ncbi:MAG: M24 family metallopeptidase [Chloroflexi bacterium]|nr:M24 family metallopeptidase [Chloroflexota bacterium]
MDEAEWLEKESRLRGMLRRRGLDAALLGRSANVAWLSGGGQSYINIASEGGGGSLLVTPDARYLITDVIEAERLRDEEGFGAGGWQIVAEPWHEPGKAITGLTAGLWVGADQPRPGMVDVSEDVARLRWLLTPAEVVRFRLLGADTGAAIGAAAAAVKPGMTEFAIAGLLVEATYKHGATPIVVLVATDERIAQRRHPLPTSRKMEHTAMLVLCARRNGLIASATRIVHQGPVPEQLKKAMQAVATIDARTIDATRPGVVVGDIFALLEEAYADVGYPGEWKNHHQGGAAGYEPREYVGTPGSKEIVQDVQAFAWNPSVPGAKSEDTFLVTQAGAELLTPSPGWPQIKVNLTDGKTVERPGVLQLR